MPQTFGPRRRFNLDSNLNFLIQKNISIPFLDFSLFIPDYCKVPVDGELRFPCFDTWAPCTLWCDGTNQCGYEDSDQGHVSYIGITSIDERYCNHSTNSTETMRPEPSALQIANQELRCGNGSAKAAWSDLNECWNIPEREQGCG